LLYHLVVLVTMNWMYDSSGKSIWLWSYIRWEFVDYRRRRNNNTQSMLHKLCAIYNRIAAITLSFSCACDNELDV
jgi:hypothetical protein